ncbi:MAG: DUF3567 domain-containing protein [Burkholderiaceae bacterium]|nr:DUF3567 domain-containing protein [Burkholderiaceae bacterium]
MQMLYNSDQYVVVAFEGLVLEPAAGAAGGGHVPVLSRGGFEIVDKHAGREIFIEGAVAESFHLGVQALVEQGPDTEALDEFIGRYTALAQQPVVLH